MGKIITAEFTSVDMAEFAARNLRRKFDQIATIKIKYRHTDTMGYNDLEYYMLPPAAYSNASFGFSDHSFNSYMATYYPAGGDRSQEEHFLMSTIEVYVEDEAASTVAGYLRALGGLAVKISGQS